MPDTTSQGLSAGMAWLCTGLFTLVLLGCNGQQSAALNDTTAAAQAQISPHSGGDPHAQLDEMAYVQLILGHWDAGRTIEAWASMGKAQKRHPQSAPLFALRSQLQHVSGESAQALASIEKAISLAPDNPDYFTNRAQLYLSFERPEEALQDLDLALALNGDHLAARFNRGSYHFNQGKHEQALADFEHCIAINPHMAAPYFNRAAVYDAMGKQDLAITDLENFIELSEQPGWTQTARDLLKAWREKAASKS